MIGELCNSCPLKGRPQVRGNGVPGGLMIIGEAPGTTEAQRGKPFVGESGLLLRQTLLALKVDPALCYMTNAVICHPPANKAPTAKAWLACRERLMEEIYLASPTKILVVGGVGLSALRGVTTAVPITKNRGRLELWQVGGPSRPLVLTQSTYHPAAVLRNNDLFRDMTRDIQRLLSSSHPEGPPEISLTIAESHEKLREELDILRPATFLACDIETTGFSVVGDRILSVAFCGLTADNEGYVVVVPESLLKEDLVKKTLYQYLSGVEYSGIWVYHNAQFDLQFLQKFFQKPLNPPKISDTMLLHYTLDERPIGSQREEPGRAASTFVSGAGHGLKSLARERYDAPDYKIDFKQFASDLKAGTADLLKLYSYQATDCFYTARLWEDLTREIHEEDPDLAWLADRILIPGMLALKDIETHGVMIDIPYFQSMSKSMKEELLQLETELNQEVQMFGLASINPSSPVQVQSLIYDHMHLSTVPGYGRSTEKEVLQALVKKTSGRNSSILQKILAFRQKSKILQTYVSGLLKRVDPDDRVRPDFMIPGTSTGRLACQNPNLQNIPVLIGEQIRWGFTVPSGWYFIEADFSQLELRVAAWYSGDGKMIQAFQEGRDLHRLVASQMFQKPEEEITHFERYLAKYVDFGVIYGRGAKSLAEGWEMDYLEDQMGGTRWTLKEAEGFLNQFMGSFPELKTWISQQQVFAMKHQHVKTPLGRRRRFPLIWRYGAESIKRQAVNTPIQSLASDLCFTSLTRIHRRLDPTRGHILFTVHDSLALEIEESYLEEALLIIREEMEENLPIESEVPFRASIKGGIRWGELFEIPYSRELGFDFTRLVEGVAPRRNNDNQNSSSSSDSSPPTSSVGRR